MTTDSAATAPVPPTVVELAGGIGPDLPDYARTKIGSVLARTGRPVPYSHLRVVRHHDPARERPIVASVQVDLDGRIVHVETSAHTPREAVDLVVDRLSHRMERLRRGPRDARSRTRDTALTDTGDPAIDVVRRPALHRGPRTVDHAVAEMLDLRFRFHLFVEASRGVDSVVHLGGPTGVRLTQADGRAELVPDGTVRVSCSADHAPRLTLAEAAERLRLAGTPFVFLREPGHERASVAYRRDDARLVVVGFDERGAGPGGPGST